MSGDKLGERPHTRTQDSVLLDAIITFQKGNVMFITVVSNRSI